MEVTLKDIQSARENIKDVIDATKLINSKKIDDLSNNKVFLKCENLQKTGSFKIRGAYNKIANLTEEQRKNGVIASSAGNHAQGVALGATAYGIKSTIVMPQGAPVAKVMATQEYGAKVVLHGNVYDEAYEKAVEIQRETGATFLHPFNDPYVIAGQGTIALEIIEEFKKVDAIIVPIGGGGLISGIAIAAKSINPDIKVIGVEAKNAASMKRSMDENKIATLDSANTIADGIAVKTPGDLTYSIIKEYVDEIVTVTEDEIANSIITLLEKEKLVVEGAGATSIAALISGKIKMKNKNVVAVISGGNIDMNMICSIIESELLKSGRKIEIKVTITDKPGHLQHLLETIADTNANISSIFQTRVKSYVNIGYQEVTMVLDTKSHEHIKEIHKKLKSKNYEIIEV